MPTQAQLQALVEQWRASATDSGLAGMTETAAALNNCADDLEKLMTAPA